MTVPAVTNRVSYSGNGSTTAFAFAYPFRATSDLVVTVRTTSTGAESLQTEGTHYTVTGTPTSDAGGFASGTVTFVTAPASGTQVHIDREPARTQTTDYIAGDGIPPSSIEGSLDRLTLLVQDLESRLARTLMQPRTAANRSLVLPEPTAARAGQVLGVNSAGTAYEMRTDGTASLGWANVTSYGAVGDGTTNATAAFTAAEATGRTVFIPEGDFSTPSSITTTTGAWFFDPQAKLTDFFNVNLIRGPFIDKMNGTNIWRFPDRVFAGAAAEYDGATATGRWSWVGTDANAQATYIERGATLLGYSAHGGTGVAGASKLSDQYTAYGYSVWTTGQSVSIGAKRGYKQRLYTATTAGTCGATPPTHTTGTASDGTVTWQHDAPTYLTPLGIASFVVSDALDGTGAWGAYVEVVRASGANGAWVAEFVAKNKGTNVSATPYTNPAGALYGLFLNGGGDPSYGGVATNPSAAGLVFSGLTPGVVWNTGILFKQTSITGADGTGGANVGTAVALARGHKLDWYNSSGIGASIWGDVSDTAKYVQLVMTDDLFAVKVRGTTALSVGNAQLGFFATSPTSKATITGSRGGNAALANLLTELAAKGLITDSTTA